MTFKLSISCDNDAMQTGEQLADALLVVEGEVRALVLVDGTAGSWKDEGLIRDVNGNTVGGWRMVW